MLSRFRIAEGHSGRRLEERLQRIAGATACQRASDQPVSQPRVLGQQRPVYVGADDATGVHPLAAVDAVVAMAAHDAAERREPGAQRGASGVVLEADQRVAIAGSAREFDRRFKNSLRLTAENRKIAGALC